MDFSTIKQRTDGGYYRDPKDWWADVMLVFANAKRYNQPGSDCHLMAQTLQVGGWRGPRVVPGTAVGELHGIMTYR